MASLAAWIGLCLAIGWLGSLPTRAALEVWYAGLIKPPLNPPAWVFAPVWTMLYLGMAVAAWRVWRLRAQSPKVPRALTYFLLQLALNGAWSPLFFGLRRPGIALLDIVVLWFAVCATLRAFSRIDKPAAMLLAPYLLWISFALYLNAGLFWLNR